MIFVLLSNEVLMEVLSALFQIQSSVLLESNHISWYYPSIKFFWSNIS